MSPRQEVREITALVPMPRLLEVLGFVVNERIRRCACALHRGSNTSAFSWYEDGRWHCFSCGAGGDKLALVRAVRSCSFPEAVEFLAQLARVEYHAKKISRAEIERARKRRERAEAAAWHVRDEIVRLRGYYMDGLHRCQRLCAQIGEQLLRARNEEERDAAWNALQRLAPAATFFLAAHRFLSDSTPSTLTRFAIGSVEQRRDLIYGASPNEQD